MKRLLVVLLALGGAVLLAEGALSLAARRSLREAWAGRLAWTRPAPPPAGDAGLYRAHPDPRVGYVLKPKASLAIFDGQIESDWLGMRRRPGPPRGPGALRLVVLGDSVAFGYGLDDEQTLACRLERELDAAQDPGARPVECRTVAIPGWNHRNAVSCLLDHMDEFAPDLVVYLPIPNDLLDSDGVDEAGKRRLAPDLCSSDPWLIVNQLGHVRYVRDATAALEAAGQPEPWAWVGPGALEADISPESSRRYDENAASIATLDRALAERGARLLLLQWTDDDYGWNLRRRLETQELQIPVLPLFGEMADGLTLGFDPHPNAETIEGVARWVAVELLRRGWVEGDAARVPAAPPAVEAARAAPHSVDEGLALAQKHRLRAWSKLSPVIDFPTSRGIGQICGGINVDGTAGAHALLVLPHGASELLVRLAPLEDRPDLYPMAVRVEIDGQAAGTLELRDGATDARLPVPARPEPAPPIEVRLIADRFGVDWVRDTGWQMRAFRPLRLQCGTETVEATPPSR